MMDDDNEAEWSPEQREAALQKWIDELPPATRDVALRYPAVRMGEVVCYRSTNNPLLHYSVYSYEDTLPVTVTLTHGADSTLPGVGTFGQPPEQLVECGCGKWRWVTDEELEKTRKHLDDYCRAKYGRGLANCDLVELDEVPMREET